MLFYEARANEMRACPCQNVEDGKTSISKAFVVHNYPIALGFCPKSTTGDWIRADWIESNSTIRGVII